MLKFKIRKKILKIRKNIKNKNIHIRFKHLYNLLSKTKNLKNKIVGGYYPINYEIDDLEIFKKLEKKKN
mgnify:CR=1 FL=1